LRNFFHTWHGIAKTAQLKAAIEIGKRVCMQEALPKDFNDAAEIPNKVKSKIIAILRDAGAPL